MGIHGLSTYLKLKESSRETQRIKRGSILCVDGLGWIFHIIEHIDGYRKELGGSYASLDKKIKEEVYQLREVMGFKLVVFMDGGQTRMKAATAAKRRKQREEKWLNLFNMTDGGSAKQRDLPAPCLLQDQLLATLKLLSVQVCS